MPKIYTQADFKKIATRVLTDWNKLGLPKIDFHKLEIKLTPIHRVGLHSQLTFMFIHEGKPLLAMKIPRYLEGRLAFAGLRNEAARLSELKKKATLSVELPELIRLTEIDGVPIVITRAYEGKMLHHYLDMEENETKLAHFIRLGVDLLIGYNVKTRAAAISVDHNFVERHLLRPTRQVLEYYPNQVAHLQQYFNEFFKREDFLGHKAPAVLAHHKFNPWNILLTPDGNLILLDWEDAKKSDLPFLDLYNFFMGVFRILYYGESREAQDRELARRRARADFLIREFKSGAEKYCRALGCCEALLDLFFLVFAVEQSAFYLDEKHRDVHYAESWLSLLTNTAARDCFVDHLSREVR